MLCDMTSTELPELLRARRFMSNRLHLHTYTYTEKKAAVGSIKSTFRGMSQTNYKYQHATITRVNTVTKIIESATRYNNYIIRLIS